MIDLNNQLEDLVEFARLSAIRGEDSNSVRKTSAYHRLSKEFDNLDELIEAIYKKTTLENFVEASIREEWEELRMRHLGAGNPEDWAGSLCFRVSLKQDERYIKFVEKHGIDSMRKIALNAIKDKPYDETEVYDEEKRKFAENNPKFRIRGTQAIGTVASDNNQMPSEGRLRYRCDNEDD